MDPKQIRELAASRWVANGDSVLLIGPPGVGETHLAVALRREAITRGYSALLVAATALVSQLSRAHSDGRLEDKLLYFTKPKLLVVDELGYLPFEANAAHLFFQLVSRRYERGSMLVTRTALCPSGAACLGMPWWQRPFGSAAAPQPRDHDSR